MTLFMIDPHIDMNQPKDLVVQSFQRECKKDDRAKTRNQNPSYQFLWIVFFIISITLAGCNSSQSQNESSKEIHGTITQVETGKDGVQVELETENGFFSVTISNIQVEFEGDFEQIKIGTEIEVIGEIIDGMEPPLVVADKVIVLRNQE